MSVRGHIQFVRQWSCGVPVSPPIRVGSPKVVAKAPKLHAMVHGAAPMLVEFCFGSAPKTVGKGRKRPVAPPLESFFLVLSLIAGLGFRLCQVTLTVPICRSIGYGSRATDALSAIK